MSNISDPSNLESELFDTSSSNIRKPIKRLNDKERLEIVRRYKKGGTSYRKLGSEYGVHESSIRKLLKNSNKVEQLTKKYKRLNDKQRLEIIERHRNGGTSNRKLAREYGVNESSVRSLIKKADLIEKRTKFVKDSEREATFRSKSSKFPKLEETLMKWIDAELLISNLPKLPVARVREKALEIADDLKISREQFKASSGWYSKFRKRRKSLLQIEYGGEEGEGGEGEESAEAEAGAIEHNYEDDPEREEKNHLETLNSIQSNIHISIKQEETKKLNSQSQYNGTIHEWMKKIEDVKIYGECLNETELSYIESMTTILKVNEALSTAYQILHDALIHKSNQTTQIV